MIINISTYSRSLIKESLNLFTSSKLNALLGSQKKIPSPCYGAARLGKERLDLVTLLLIFFFPLVLGGFFLVEMMVGKWVDQLIG